MKCVLSAQAVDTLVGEFYTGEKNEVVKVITVVLHCKRSCAAGLLKLIFS